MTPEQHNAKVVWALEKADDYLHTAWKHSEYPSEEYRRINDAQAIIHKVIRKLKDAK